MTDSTLSIDELNQECFVCGKPASTDEHIFPKWLQRKFDLWNQTMRLPNDTEIKYRQLTIPCCAQCNGTYLSQIEDAVKKNSATDSQLWKWGLKVHLGLLSKHKELWWDRKEKSATLADILSHTTDISFEKQLIGAINNTFSTSPDPFGSVFRFHFEQDEGYHFAHLLNPSGLMFCLGKIGYVIFIKDTGSLSRTTSLRPLIEKTQQEASLGTLLNFFANCWIHLYRFRATHSQLRTPTSIAILGPGRLREEIEFTDEQFKILWSILTGASFSSQVSP
jgi:hypothetical protein